MPQNFLCPQRDQPLLLPAGMATSRGVVYENATS
jgi:hypothetical protein